MEAGPADGCSGHACGCTSALGQGAATSKQDARWDALLGINPSAWWASLRRTPLLLRQRAFHTRTLADALEASALLLMMSHASGAFAHGMDSSVERANW